MGRLSLAWASLIITGVWLFALDFVFQVVLEVRGIPALSALGVALFLLALASILNWLFKVAWDERTRHYPDSENRQHNPVE